MNSPNYDLIVSEDRDEEAGQKSGGAEEEVWLEAEQEHNKKSCFVCLGPLW